MELKVKIIEEIDDYDDICRYQEINDKENNISFSVSNLDYCPEDAIIDRRLFSANDYIKALNKGIELANKGITKVTGEK